MLQKVHTATLNGADGHGHHGESHSVFGFWLYLMTDCVLFASLFAVFAVMAHQFNAGPTGKDLFDIPGVAVETAALLLSSITYGFAMVAARRQNTRAVLGWLAVTFVLGLVFLKLELGEFSHLLAEGAGPSRSAFLSSFFVLVGTHGLHVAMGLIWMAVLAVQVARAPQLTQREITRLTCLSLFWHFLDVVWICVFTFVYLGSAI
ncbi:MULTISPECIES: cytochrome o ubiquinol oxidase subunit III [Paraburkholderia]|jgi:cytochrome o ubiquinol oxidase subunit 3|uniref:Cytochrome bo(3) ubiquinol oxidase subunit 3 n=2 Tax=Paraburkholderia hospita TaxID=169430 RepID=A0ABN0F7C7_9BURK|nr:cytochrome o ubiquinol oxidase subunit III [Paraburkholderia hospita]EUC13206.1 cytochrome o ubiquinol oxidase, subunit III [Burkholderia sp. BT03]EIM94513.1 cytochrome o ubiquinol oxidase subunit III [Paraburkholderia hospita]OUL85843.1 cytochrome o ubiquinol oxidase subunit III [Paraburkholderia hospita]OUL93146.1 cytochrome o ubiquinol oxidase subunit III [Paraburkholderia hospita]SEI28047.1 cytochrome bo3 quinol oxidase subunit 3 [Paraburkholderia hospita]